MKDINGLKKTAALILSFALSTSALGEFTASSQYVSAANANETEVTKYSYTITPLLEPFNEYFFVKTDNPDPLSFRFADKNSKYSDTSTISLNYDSWDKKVILYADIRYENEKTGRVDGGYIFAGHGTDGGEVVLQESVKENDRYNTTSWKDTEVKLSVPVVKSDVDYLVDTYATKSGFFENMDAVQSGFRSICLYSGSYIRGEVYRANKYWFLSSSPHMDQNFYIQSPYRRKDSKSLFASAIYPFRYDSLGFPSVMASVAKTLDDSAEYEWNEGVHYLIYVTYNGETRSYGGAGRGSGQGLTEDKIRDYFTFGQEAKSITLESSRELLDYYSSIEMDDDIPHVDDLTWSDVNKAIGMGSWVRLCGIASIFGSTYSAFSYFYKENEDSSSEGMPSYISDAWVDGRYVNSYEVFEYGSKFEDHPNSNIYLENVTYPYIKYQGEYVRDAETGKYKYVYKSVTGIKEKKCNILFYYSSDRDAWIADYWPDEENTAGNYDIIRMVESGILDKKYQDMIMLTREQVTALSVDRNSEVYPQKGVSFDEYEEPGVPFEINSLTDENTEIILSQTVMDYNRDVQYPEITVKYNGKILREDIDYYLSYSDYESHTPGEYTVTICGFRNFTGSFERKYRIRERDISDAEVIFDSDQTYNGWAICPSVTVMADGNELDSYYDYDVSYENNVNHGTAKIIITAKGSYSGRIEKTFTIKKRDISGIDIGEVHDVYATGHPITFDLDEIYSSEFEGYLINSSDYTVSYKNNTNVGTATVTLTGIGNCFGKTEKTFKIKKRDISGFSGYEIWDRYYTGKPLTFDFGTLYSDEEYVRCYEDGYYYYTMLSIENGKDYKVTYKNNTEPGTATVIITGIGNFTGTIEKTFKITKMDISEVYIPEFDYVYYDGKPVTLYLDELYDPEGTLIKDRDYTVEYKNNDRPGTASYTITGIKKYGGSVTKTFRIRKPTKSLDIKQKDITIGLGESLKLTPVTDPAEIEGDLEWWSYSYYGENVCAEVSTDGTIKGIRTGTSQIGLCTDDGYYISRDVTVVPAPTSVKLNTGNKSLAIGDSFTLKATLPSGTASALTWSSSDSSIVSVNNGKMNAKKAGTATITVKTFNNKTAACTVIVKAAPTSVTLNKTQKTIGVGETYSLKATLPSGTASALTWTSSNSSVVSVSGGKLTAKKAGTATITVKTFNGKTATCKITVKVAPSKVTLNKTSKTIGVGETYSLKATLPSNTASGTMTWTSSNSNVVTVKDGKLTAKKTGTATITAKTFNGKTATCKITVKAAPTSISLNKTKKTTGVGETYSLKATLSSNTASGTMTWTSSNSNVVTVKDGKLTAKKTGTATVTAKTFNGKTASCVITVKAAPAKVTLSKTSCTMKKGGTFTLKATLPSGTASGTMTWTSSNTDVVTVKDGKLTAKKAGTATITVKTFNGKTASCRVTVK